MDESHSSACFNGWGTHSIIQKKLHINRKPYQSVMPRKRDDPQMLDFQGELGEMVCRESIQGISSILTNK